MRLVIVGVVTFGTNMTIIDIPIVIIPILLVACRVVSNIGILFRRYADIVGYVVDDMVR